VAASSRTGYPLSCVGKENKEEEIYQRLRRKIA
jgi:hypothetical protein